MKLFAKLFISMLTMIYLIGCSDTMNSGNNPPPETEDVPLISELRTAILRYDELYGEAKKIMTRGGSAVKVEYTVSESCWLSMSPEGWEYAFLRMKAYADKVEWELDLNMEFADLYSLSANVDFSYFLNCLNIISDAPFTMAEINKFVEDDAESHQGKMFENTLRARFKVDDEKKRHWDLHIVDELYGYLRISGESNKRVGGLLTYLNQLYPQIDSDNVNLQLEYNKRYYFSNDDNECSEGVAISIDIKNIQATLERSDYRLNLSSSYFLVDSARQEYTNTIDAGMLYELAKLYTEVPVDQTTFENFIYRQTREYDLAKKNGEYLVIDEAIGDDYWRLSLQIKSYAEITLNSQIKQR